MMSAFATMPKYERYKDTDFDWIGQVPEGWEVTKLGACLKPVSIKNKPELPLLSITREQGVIERDLENQDSNHNFIPDDLSGYKMLRKGQFGMNKMKAWQGSYGVSDYTGIVSPAYFIFDFAKPIEPKFFNWAIRSKLYVSYFGSASDGVRIGQWDLSKDRMKAIPFILPTTCEQKLITDFLDEKTAQIDEAIAIKEKQIALLKERKQIIIQKAVTQGLNPDVPMKDSGVDWIGQIPEHWEVKKLKHGVKIQGGFAFQSTDFKDEGIQLLKIANLYQNRLALERQPTFLSENLLKKYRDWVVKKGDILMSLTGTLGKRDYGFAILLESDEKYFLNQRVARLTAGDLFEARYLTNLLQSESYLNQIYQLPAGTKQANLSNDNVVNAYVPVPSFREQEEIADFIEVSSRENSKLITLQIEQIEQLKEYKATLINSAVTGKIKVA